MYDPHSAPPSFDDLPPPEGPRDNQNRTLLMWGIIAAVGALIVMVLSCAFIAIFILPPLSREISGQPGGQPDQPAAAETAEAAPPDGTTSGATSPPPVAPDPEELAIPPGPVLIEEDFEEPSTRWGQSSSQVRDGAYELRLETPNNDHYGLLLISTAVQDFDMAVDVEQIDGDPAAEYGIRFRQSGPGDYLLFSMSGTGHYRLVRVVDEEYNELVPWTANADINTGDGAVNRLRVEASGETLVMSLNDEQVIEIPDEDPVAGQLTLGIGTFDAGGLAVRFDNIAGDAEGEILDEDFSDPENVAWSIGGARFVESGQYEIFAGGGIQSWQHPLPEGLSEVENFVVEVETTLVDSGEGTAYGIIFGDTGSFEYYSFLILPEGGITLLYNGPDGGEILIEPLPLSALETGTNATNTIRLEVREQQTLLIAVNGEELPPLTSPEPFQSGMVGMIVSSGAAGRVQAQFDNFYLEEVIEGEDM